MGVKLELKINLEGKDNATKTFKAVGQAASSLSSKITAISTAYMAFGAKLAQAFGAPLKAAAANEKVNVQLATTMKALGQYTDASYRKMLDFSNVLETATGTEEEVIKGIERQNIALGMNASQAEAAAVAAAGLAAVSGKDLVSANEAFLASLQGNSRELKKWIPGLAELSVAQLRAGAAYDLGIGKLSKFVGADAASTSGALDRLGNALNDVAKDAAQSVLEGMGLGAGFDGLMSSIDDLGLSVKTIKPELQALGKMIATEGVKAFKEFTEVLRIMAPVLPTVLRSILDLIKVALIPFVNILLSLGAIYARVKGDKRLEEAFDELRVHLTATFKAAGKELLGFTDDVGRLPAVLDDSFQKVQAKTEEREGVIAKFFRNWGNSIRGGFKGMQQDQRQAMNDAKENTAQWAQILGANSVAAAARGGGPALSPADLRRGDDSNTSTYTPTLGGKKFGTFKQPMSDEMKQKQLQMQKAISEQTLALVLAEGNEVVSEHAQRMAKIHALETEAAHDGLNVSKQANELKAAMADDLQQKLAVQYSQDRLAAAQAAGNELDTAERAYDEQMRAYREMVKKKRMTDEEYTAAQDAEIAKRVQASIAFATKVAELTGDTKGSILSEYRTKVNEIENLFLMGSISDEELAAGLKEQNRLREEALSQTTGTKAMDSAMSKAAALVGSVQGGLSAVIGQVGAMFGPIGTLIAGIIQMLMMGPQQFQQMINSLISAIPVMFKNVLTENLPYLIEAIPAFLAEIFQTVLSVPFWIKVVSSLWTALMHMFQNFWSVLFGKGDLKSAFKQNLLPDKKLATFGSDDPNAGGGEFKIKDAQLAGSRRAADKFEDSFADAVDLGGVNFVNMLKEGFQQAIDMLGRFFSTIGKAIWSDLSNAASTIGSWGTAIWNGFNNTMNAAAAALAGLGNIIGQGLKAFLDTIWNWFDGAGRHLGEGLKAFLDTIWSWFEGAGRNIGGGLKAGLDSIWGWFRDAGTEIANGLKSAVGGGGGGLGAAASGAYHAALGHNQGGVIGSVGQGSALAAAFAAAGVQRYASGGMVGGSGFGDSVPALLTPGEVVWNRKQVADAAKADGGGGQTITLTFNVAAGAKVDRDAVREFMPMVVDQLKRMSKNGTNVMRPGGVY